VSAAYWLAKRLRAGRYAAFVVAAAATAACLLLYGSGPSAVRACVMCLTVHLARLFARPYDPATSLGLAAIVILAADPSSAADVSFLLSFGCCAAISVIYPAAGSAVDRAIKRRGPLAGAARGLLKTLSLSCTISAVTFPVMVIYGIPLSLVSPLTNIPVVALTPILMISAALTCLPLEPLSALFGLVAGVCSGAVIDISGFAASFSLASVATGAPYLKVWLVFCAAVAAVFVAYKKRRVRVRFAAACAALVLAVGMLSRMVFTVGKPSVTLYRDNVVVAQDRGRAMVVIREIDRDGADYLLSYLQYRYVDEVSYLFILEDSGDAVLLYLRQIFPDAVVAACYETDLPGVISSGEADYFQRMGRLGVLVHNSGRVEISAEGAVICVDIDAGAKYAGFDVVALLVDGSPRGRFYLVGERVYRADGSVVLYVGEDGGIKAVAE
jgi:ComEC/Rec2-related protein